MHTIMQGFRSKNLSYYIEEAEDHMKDLLKRHKPEVATAILNSATATYNRSWLTELFWQDFQLTMRDHRIPVDVNLTDLGG